MIKTITFTCMHFVIAFTVAYILTGSITVGGLVAIVEPLCNAVGFYFHEKIWNRVNKHSKTKGMNDRANYGVLSV